MTTQVVNPESTELNSTEFPRRNEPNYAWKSAVASLLGLPMLRAAWSMSAVNYAAAGRIPDATGSGYSLTSVNTPTFGGGDPLHFYANFVGASSQVLYRLDGGAANWADIIGTEAYIVAAQRGLTLGGWYYFGNAIGAQEDLAGKWVAAAGARAYRIYRGAAGTLSFQVRDAADAATTTATSTGTVSSSAWHLLAGRYYPSTRQDAWIDDDYTSLAVGVPASILDATSDFAIGASGTAAGGWSNHFTGKASLCFLCAGALSDAMLWSFYQQTRKAFGV